MQEKLKSLYKPDKMASRDFLNDIQRAFMKYKAQTAIETGDHMNSLFAKQLINDGVKANIWDESFTPGDLGDFEKYVLNRMKNERKSIQRKAMLETQAELVWQFMDTAEQDESVLLSDLSEIDS